MQTVCVHVGVGQGGVQPDREVEKKLTVSLVVRTFQCVECTKQSWASERGSQQT